MKLFGAKKETEPAGDGEETCEIKGCNSPKHRSVSAKAVAKAGLDVSNKTRGKVHLCREHYKEYKKATKKDRELERLGR